MKHIIVAASLLSLVTISLSAPGTKAGAQTPIDKAVQAANDYKKADAELTVVYKKLLARLPQYERAKLAKAQRAWNAYREAEMDFSFEGFKSGAVDPMVQYQAAARITRNRTSDLNWYLKDLSNR